MEALLLNLGKLAGGFLGMLGPIAFLMALRGVRDRRESALTLTVLGELNSPELRGLFSLKVKSRFIGKDSVVVDLWDCPPEQVWDVMEKLSAKLPSDVGVEVNGLSDSRSRSAWTVTATRRFDSPALCP
jgi:hypothetical protein